MKVAEWKRYIKGFKDKHGKEVKLSLAHAAALIGVKKKTLDDYVKLIK